MPLPPANPARAHPMTHDERIATRLAALERHVRTLEQYISGGSTQQIPVVDVLPAAGRKGRIVIYTGSGTPDRLWRDNGALWVAVG